MKKNYYQTLNVKRGWTKIPNAIRHDEKLTSDAKVVIEELLSVSGDYHIHEAGIASSLNLSLVRVKNAIRLLKSAGYIQITKVKDGSRFGGCEWGISDTAGTFQSSENRTLGNRTNGNAINLNDNSDSSETDRMESASFENIPIYQITEGFQQTNNQKQNIQLTEEEDEKREITPSRTPLSPSGESIVSQQELNITQAFNRFCEVYPNLGDRDQARAAFFAIPDIDKICHQIVNSVAWFEKSKRWDNWTTGQKNVACPKAVKFLKQGDWRQFLNSGATVSEEERIMAALNRSRQNNNSIFGGAEYGTN